MEGRQGGALRIVRRPFGWAVVGLILAGFAGEGSREAELKRGGASSDRAVVAARATAGPSGSLNTSPEDGRPRRLDEIRALIKAGRYAEAESLARGLLAEIEAAAPDSSALADVLDLLVESMTRGGKSGDPATLDLARRVVAERGRVPGAEGPPVATSLVSLGIILVNRGDFEEARSVYERALGIRERTLGADHPDVAGVLNRLGILLRNTGELAEARRVLERALEIKERTGTAEDAEASGILNSLGTVESRLGESAPARIHMERALAIREAVLGPAHPSVAIVLNNLAVHLREMGEYAATRPLLERALAISEATLGPEHPEVALNLENLGNLLADLGDGAGARASYERALAIQEKRLGSEHVEVAATLSNLCTLTLETGDLPAARAFCERALSIRERHLPPGHPDLAWSLNSLGTILVRAGERGTGERMLLRALGIREKALGPDHPDVAYSLEELAGLSLTSGDPIRAKTLNERALGIRRDALGPMHPAVAESLAALALAHWQGREREKALETALEAEAVAREHLRACTRSVAEREALRYEAVRVSGMDTALSVLDSPGNPRPVSEIAVRVWDELIRSRALVLDEMARRHRRVLEIGDPEIARAAESLQAARSELSRLVVKGPDGARPREYPARLREARDAMERAERVLAEKSLVFRSEEARIDVGYADVVARLPERSALVAYARHAQVPSSAQAEPLLHRSSASEDGSRSLPGEPRDVFTAFVLGARGGRPTVVPLGSAREIGRLVGRWRETVGSAPENAASLAANRAAGERLRRAVWDPLSKHVAGAGLVFVVPDGILHLVSLAALPGNGDRYLLEEGPVFHYLSAERDLARGGDAPGGGSGLLIVGAPDFDARPQEPPPPSGGAAPPPAGAGQAARPAGDAPHQGATSACERFDSMRFGSLPGAEAEAAEVEAMWMRTRGSAGAGPAAVLSLTGPLAGEGSFRRLAPGRRFIHLATHGFFVQDRCGPSSGEAGFRPESTWNPGERDQRGEIALLLSGLAFAGANRRDEASARPHGDDGVLTAEEIASLDLRSAEWVVLSACGTGLGPVQPGEGVLGLRRAFEVAGARTLIMSLWSVEDHASREWIHNLYERRLSGRSTAEAVRAAGLRILGARRRAGVTTHPFYWGAFVAAGDWR